MKPPLMNEADSSLPGLWTTWYVIHHFLVVATHNVLCVVTMCANLQQEVFSLIYHPFDFWRLDSYLSHLGLVPSIVPGRANSPNKREQMCERVEAMAVLAIGEIEDVF